MRSCKTFQTQSQSTKKLHVNVSLASLASIFVFAGSVEHSLTFAQDHLIIISLKEFAQFQLCSIISSHSTLIFVIVNVKRDETGSFQLGLWIIIK